MTDDRERGEEVVEVLLPLLRSCTALRVGEPTRLRHRGGGLRLVLDVQPDTTAYAVRVDREDGVGSSPAGRDGPGGRRALPPR